jgi:hypothetical protein
LFPNAGSATAADTVLEEAGWSLYCLDQPTQSAVFVQVPPDCDLSATPFMRMAQYEQASRVILIPWTDLDDIAARVALPENLIFVFGIGRSGTTLVSHMLGLVEGVISLSEPNAQFDATDFRHGNSPDVTRRLIAACTRLLCHQPDGSVPNTQAFKLYSQSLFSCLDYHASFPQAKFVFLYRDAVGWANSVYKMVRGYGAAGTLDRAGRDTIWRITSSGQDIALLERSLSTSGEVYHLEDIAAASWSLHFEHYTTCLEAGVPFLALRYNEIVADREGSTCALLTHCGLQADQAASVLRSFDTDSQDGSGIGQDNKIAGFTPEQVERFLRALGRQKRFTSPDWILPDVYRRQ